MASVTVNGLVFEGTPDPGDYFEIQKAASPNQSRFTSISLAVASCFPAILAASGNRATVGQYGSVQQAVTVDFSVLTVSNPPTQAEVQAIITKLTVLTTAMQTAKQMV